MYPQSKRERENRQTETEKDTEIEIKIQKNPLLPKSTFTQYVQCEVVTNFSVLNKHEKRYFSKMGSKITISFLQIF